MPTIVVLGPPGRMGNRLHLFAGVMAFALRHDLRVVNFGFLRYAHLFTGTRGDVLYCGYPPPGGSGAAPGFAGRAARLGARAAVRLTVPLLRLVPDRLVMDMSQDATRIARNLDRVERALASRRVVAIRGFSFRDMEGIERHAAAIRDHFRPVEPHASAVAGRARALRRGSVLVGVHVRKTDFRTYKAGKYDYSVEEYARLVRRAAVLLGGASEVSFALVSDDPGAARRIAGACPGLTVGFGSGHALEDLYLLAACDRLVGPPSTFTKWASFYGETPLYVVGDPAAPFTLDDFLVYRDLRPWLD